MILHFLLYNSLAALGVLVILTLLFSSEHGDDTAKFFDMLVDEPFTRELGIYRVMAKYSFWSLMPAMTVIGCTLNIVAWLLNGDSLVVNFVRNNAFAVGVFSISCVVYALLAIFRGYDCANATLTVVLIVSVPILFWTYGFDLAMHRFFPDKGCVHSKRSTRF